MFFLKDFYGLFNILFYCLTFLKNILGHLKLFDDISISKFSFHSLSLSLKLCRKGKSLPLWISKRAMGSQFAS